MSDVDIVIDIATTNVKSVYNLSNALQGLNRVVAGAVNPIKNLDARSRALSQAIGASDGSLKSHAKTLGEVSRNNAILTSELSRVRQELKGLGSSYKYATGTSATWKNQAVKDLKAYEAGLKQVRIRALTEDLKSLSVEQKRLGKDAQFVGRSLIIGLTTPIMMFSRYALQSLVSVDKEFVRLNKVLESVAPNLEMAAKKMGIDLGSATDAQNKRLNEMVENYQRLEKALTNTSIKFGLSKNIAVGLAGEFAELGIQSTEAIAKITELTAATEKLGDMDIGAAKDLVQSLYFQAVRAMQQSGESRNISAIERENKAIAAATAQLNLFNAVENTTALTLRDLGDAFPEVAAAATSFGLSMTEAAGLLAPMKAAGFEVGASANSIKVSLQRITAPTKQNKELFKDLTKEYKMNFDLIQGTGVDAIQSLIDAYNTLSKSSAGQEGIMEFFAKVFGVRQGPRMEVAIAQAAEFDRTLKDASISTDRAEKRIQKFANEIISSSNAANKGTIPLINSYKDIAIVARIATAAIDPAKGFAVVEGYGAVTQKQISEAKKVRDQIGKTLLKESQKTGEDLIGQVATETGRAMIVELAGTSSAAEVANRELATALSSLDVQIKIMRNSFKMMATEILKQVTPAIKKLSEFATKLYDAFMALDPAQRDLLAKMVLGFTAAAAAVGPLVFIFGQFRLAIGTAGKVLFGFLPGLKTLSVETLAAKSGMLKLRNGLIAVGDTVYNNNTRFATFIATLASGEGPVAKMATKFGVLTGALKETTTAQTALTTAVMERKAEREILPTTTTRVGGRRITTRFPKSPLIGTTGAITGGPPEPVRAIKRFRGGFRDILDPTRAVPIADQIIFEEEEDLIRRRTGLGGTPGTARYSLRQRKLGRAGTTGIKRFIPKPVTRPTSIASEIVGQAVAMRQQGYIDTGITRTAANRFLRGGREISEDKALRIAGGGVRGRIVGAIDTLQTKGGAAAGAVKAGPATAMTAYKNATTAASKAVQDLTKYNLAFGKGAPGLMAKAKVSVIGFAKSFSFVTKAINLMKVAFIGTGIGLALLAVAAIVYMVAKNFDEFKKKIAPAMESFKAAFNAIKEGAMALIQPFIDLFSQIGGGSGDSASQISAIGTAVNIVAEVVEFLAKVVKVVFQIIGKVIRFFLGNWVSIFRGIFDIVKGFKKILSGDLLGGLKQVFGGVIKIVYGWLGPFRFVFDWILKGLILLAKGASKALGWIPGLGGKVKSAVKGLENLQGFLKGATNIKASVKVQGKGKIDPKDVDTDDAQEKIANATGTGIKEGASEGAKELAKTLATRLKNLKKELQEEVVNRVKGAMEDVVSGLTDSLKNQKEAALKIYDDQIEAINDLKRKEEELTKTKEYENRKREIEQKRALNALNSQRAYELAIYEGRIDDAREINFERQKNETESNKELEDLNTSREKDLQEAARATLIDSINDAKKAASDYFDDMIKKFTDSAKKITEFPPTTAQEFQTQLEQLGTAAKEAANGIGTNFSSSFTGLLGNLGVNSEGPLTTALEGIGKILTDNNPFGKDGVWQKSIDGAIDYLTKKYDGLYNTLTMVIDTKSSQFKKLFETYNKYQTLVDAESGTGGGGGAGGGDGKGTGQGAGSTQAQPGYYYRSKERGQKTWSSWVGPRKLDEINAIKPILQKTGLFEFKFSNYNPGMVNVGASVGNATSTISAIARAVGGVIPFAQGGPTQGPVQQGIPAILHGGEYVVRNSAVKKYGWGMMQQINQGTYKPKPFANGGMIDRRVVRTDPSMKEWMWQQNQGGLTKEYLEAMGMTESGDIWSGKQPQWGTRVKTSHGWMGGGFRIADTTWRDYGGGQFAPTADKASKLAQMVIKNRINLFGYINEGRVLKPIGMSGSIFPADLDKFNKPLFARPEDFNPNLDLLSQVTKVKQDFTTPQSGSGYATKAGGDFFKKYFTQKPRNANRILMYGQDPMWFKGEGSTASRIKAPSGFYKGGIVDESRNVRGGNVGLKNIQPKKKTGGVFGFLNKVQSGVDKALLTTADFMDYAYQQVIGIPMESLQASTLNPLAKALNIPGSENLRVAGMQEGALNMAFLALDVATAKMATGPITALRMAMLDTAVTATGGRVGARALENAFTKQAFIKAMDSTFLGRPIATSRVSDKLIPPSKRGISNVEDYVIGIHASPKQGLSQILPSTNPFRKGQVYFFDPAGLEYNVEGILQKARPYTRLKPGMTDPDFAGGEIYLMKVPKSSLGPSHARPPILMSRSPGEIIGSIRPTEIPGRLMPDFKASDLEKLFVSQGLIPKKEPFITEMGAHILANVEASRLTRASRNMPFSGFAPEYLPVPKGGFRRPSLGGGWKGFVEMERIQQAAASATRRATSGPKSVGAAVNPDLIRQTVLENIAISREARRAANKALQPGFPYFVKDVVGEEAKRQMALPEGEVLRSVRNRITSAITQYTDQEKFFGFGPRKTYTPYAFIPDELRTPSLGGGRAGFFAQTSDAALTNARVRANIAISKSIREATQTTRGYYTPIYRELAGEEARRQQMLPFGEMLRSARTQNRMGTIYGQTGLTTDNPYYRTNRPKVVEQTPATGNKTVLGGGFKRYIEQAESQLANDIIETNKRIRIQAQIRRNVEGNIAISRETRFARQLASASEIAKSLGITDQLMNDLLSGGFTFDDLLKMPKSVIKRVAQPASKVVRITKNRAPYYKVEVLRKISENIAQSDLNNAGFSNDPLDQVLRDFAHVSASITGYVRGDTFDVSGMYAAHGSGSDVTDIVAALYREVLLPNNITKIENTNTLSEQSSRLLNNVAEYISFLNPNMQVVGRTTQGNDIRAFRPGELQDTLRIRDLGFASVDEMIASVGRGDIITSDEYSLLGNPAERLKNALFVQQLGEAKRKAMAARRGITPKFTGGLIQSLAKGGIVDESGNIRGGNIGLKNKKPSYLSNIYKPIDFIPPSEMDGIMGVVGNTIVQTPDIVANAAKSLIDGRAWRGIVNYGKSLYRTVTGQNFIDAMELPTAKERSAAINMAMITDTLNWLDILPMAKGATSLAKPIVDRAAIKLIGEVGVKTIGKGLESGIAKEAAETILEKNIRANVARSATIRQLAQVAKFYGSKNELSILTRGSDLYNIIESGIIDSRLATSSGYITNKKFLGELGLSHEGYSNYASIRESMQSPYGVLRGNSNYGIVRRSDDFLTASQYTGFHVNIQEAGELFGSEKGAAAWYFQRQMDDLLGSVWIDLKPNPKMTYSLGDSYNMYVRSQIARLTPEPGYAYLNDLTKANLIPRNLDEIPLTTIKGKEMFPSHGHYTELQFPATKFGKDQIKRVTVLRDIDWEKMSPLELYSHVMSSRGTKQLGWGAEETAFIGLQESLVHQREMLQKVKSLGIQTRTGAKGIWGRTGEVDKYGSPIVDLMPPSFDKISLGDMNDYQFNQYLLRLKNKIDQGSYLSKQRNRLYTSDIRIPRSFNGGLIPSLANGGVVPKFDSMAVPAILHGGEYVVNSKAVKNIGYATLQAMNNMRFQKPASPSYAGPVSGQSSSTSTVHIYVDNFIGQKDWFESMMKDYNVTVVPQNQKAAGLENRTIRTYSGINRGM